MRKHATFCVFGFGCIRVWCCSMFLKRTQSTLYQLQHRLPHENLFLMKMINERDRFQNFDVALPSQMSCTHDFDSFQHDASKRRARSTTNVENNAGIDESSCTVLARLRHMRCYSIKRQAFGLNVRARNSVACFRRLAGESDHLHSYR